MKSSVSFAIIASVVCIASTTKFSQDEIYKFLPFLKTYAPPSCKENEIYTTCAGQCSDCTQRGKCAIKQCESKCDCIPRFYRLKPDGPCVPVAFCPIPECGENEVFRACGPICEKCTTRKCRVINCDYRCYCKEGYLRNSDGVCIPQEECPKRLTCSYNEEWRESGPTEEFCLHGEDTILSNDTQNIAQCYCNEGFKRNALGICIFDILCPFMECLGVEIYHDCIRKCDTTCRNYGNPNCTEDENCYPGCFCPPGYVMNDLRTCVPIEQCPDLTKTKIVEPTKIDDASPNNETTVASSSFVDHQNGTDGAENLKSDGTENPESDVAETPGSDVAENPGSDVAENPGSDVAENPGSDVAENPGSDLTENPGSDIAENPESDVAENPGSDVAENPGSDVAEKTGSDVTEKPRLDGTENPGLDGDEKSESDKTENPIIDENAESARDEEATTNGVTSSADDVTNTNDNSEISDSDKTANSGTEEVST